MRFEVGDVLRLRSDIPTEYRILDEYVIIVAIDKKPEIYRYMRMSDGVNYHWENSVRFTKKFEDIYELAY